MKRFYLFGGIIICVISIGIGIKNKEKISVITSGQIIEVEIVDVPVPCNLRNRKIKPFFRFIYKNRIYSKNLKDEYCDSIVDGEIISLKTNSSENIFVFTNETLTSQLVYSGVLFIIGLFFIYKDIKE